MIYSIRAGVLALLALASACTDPTDEGSANSVDLTISRFPEPYCKVEATASAKIQGRALLGLIQDIDTKVARRNQQKTINLDGQKVMVSYRDHDFDGIWDSLSASTKSADPSFVASLLPGQVTVKTVSDPRGACSGITHYLESSESDIGVVDTVISNYCDDHLTCSIGPDISCIKPNQSRTYSYVAIVRKDGSRLFLHDVQKKSYTPAVKEGPVCDSNGE